MVCEYERWTGVSPDCDVRDLRIKAEEGERIKKKSKTDF